MTNGTWFQEINVEITSQTQPAMRVHTDASYNSNKILGHQGGIVGMGWCIELSDDAPADSIPNFGYSTDTRPLNSSSAVAELRGMVFALQSLPNDIRDVQLVCDNKDSVRLANYILSGGSPDDFNVNAEIMRELRRLSYNFQDMGITAVWQRGHSSNNPYNHMVNCLARTARRIAERSALAPREADVQIYTGFKEREISRTFIQMRSGEHPMCSVTETKRRRRKSSK